MKPVFKYAVCFFVVLSLSFPSVPTAATKKYEKKKEEPPVKLSPQTQADADDGSVGQRSRGQNKSF